VRGVKASGCKEGRTASQSSPVRASIGVFTTNNVTAAPVIVTPKHLIESKQILAVVANSGSANAFTGPNGIEDAERVADPLRATCTFAQPTLPWRQLRHRNPLNVSWIDSKIIEVLPTITDAADGSLEAAERYDD